MYAAVSPAAPPPKMRYLHLWVVIFGPLLVAEGHAEGGGAAAAARLWPRRASASSRKASRPAGDLAIDFGGGLWLSRAAGSKVNDGGA